MILFLCGFMGCGKSAMGRALAWKLRLPLIDTDAYIVEQEGMSIPEIFEKKGEPYFRKVEAEAIRSLCSRNAIVACGGGAMLTPDTAAAARAAGTVALIDQTFEVCYSRIKDDTNRPIVQKNTKEQLREIFNARDGIYRAHANLIVPPADTPEETAQRLIELLGIPMPTGAASEVQEQK